MSNIQDNCAGVKELTFDDIQSKFQFQYYAEGAMRHLFATYGPKGKPGGRRMRLHDARQKTLWALNAPKLKRTALTRPSREEWQQLYSFKSRVFESFEFPHKLAVALNEVIGDLHSGRISDASLLKLETALSFELEGGSDKDFYLAIYKISYDHGQYDKKAYEIECQQVREKGAPKL